MKILYITTIGGTMNFFQAFIEELVRKGHTIDIACNDSISKVSDFFYKLGCKVYSIQVSRSPVNIGNLNAIEQIKKLVNDNQYDIVHCHTPVAAMCTRLACQKARKSGTKVFYTAHGFHFYKGAPKLNWLVYYPIEKFCSRFTDKLITINKEDYALAQKKFHAKEVHYVPGVGIDLSKFENVQVDRAAKRREIGVPENATLMISVGELSERKNHKLALKALSLTRRTDIHYVIVGRGALAQELRDLAEEYRIGSRVHLLGYRKDIAELYKASDICCFPSFQEGLPVAVMEAMACGLPVVCSDIRGNVDLITEEGGALFSPHCAKNCADAIMRVLSENIDSMGKSNKDRVVNYSVGTITAIMKSIYER